MPHDHNNHNHGHEHKHEHEHQPERPKSIFARAAKFIGKHKPMAVLGGTALLATTALATPLLTTTAGAVTALAAGLGIMALASDMAIHGTEHLGTKLGISPLAMGIFGLGALHSIPELAVALFSVASGAADLALGNLVGANVAHVFLIMGATAAIAGIAKGKGQSWKFNTKAMTGATLALGGLLATGMLTPLTGAGMLAAAGAYLYRNVQIAKQDAKMLGMKPEELIHNHDHGDDEECSHSHGHEHDHDHSHNHEHGHTHDKPKNKWRTIKDVFLAASGMGALIYSADIVVDSSIQLAGNIGIGQAAMGALAVAIGTSLPELTTNINLALKGKTDMAVGNILGCNIYNILFIGGVLSMANMEVPPAFSPTTSLGLFNLAALGTSAALMSSTLLRGKGEVKKWQGYTALGLYAGYCAATVAMGGAPAPA
jgi:cation:H+ antiporter